MNDLRELLRAEEGSVERSFELLGKFETLPHDISELYREFLRRLGQTKGLTKDQRFMNGIFMLGCQYQLLIGMLAALRGHLTDSMVYLRKAIEFGAFAALVKRNPELALKWVRAETDEESYEEYKRRFRGGKNLFPPSDKLLQHLGETYDMCAQMSHPSLAALSRHSKGFDAKGYMSYEYMEFTPSDPREPIRTIGLILVTHLEIIGLFEKLIPKVISGTKGEWPRTKDAAIMRFRAFRSQWRPIFDDLKSQDEEGLASE